MSGEFSEVLQKKIARHPNRLAVIDGSLELNYRMLGEQVERFAGALNNLELSSKSKLGILCVNQNENLIALLACFQSRLPVVPLNPLLGLEDLIFIVRDAGIDVLLLNGMFVKPETVPFLKLFTRVIVTQPFPSLEQLASNVIMFEEFMESANPFSKSHQRKRGIPGVLMYTSGTTDRPKGVMLEEEQFYINIQDFLSRLGLQENERCIVALPMFHSFGNIMVLAILSGGGTLIFLPQFQPKTILTKIKEHRATVLPLVPTIYSFLADLVARGGFDVSSLRLCISGGASLPQALFHRVGSVLKVTVLEGYGLTETSPVISVNDIRDERVPGSVGFVLPNVELKIADDFGNDCAHNSTGEIWVRGPTVMKGYWNRPEDNLTAFTDDGWFRTGDLGHLDEKRRLYISAGRIKDLIIRAGENISPLAIENAVMNHPAVIEVSAIGVPDQRAGERVRLCIVRREGMDTTEAEIKNFCRDKLSSHMCPDEVKFFDALPKTATGKVIKSVLREN